MIAYPRATLAVIEAQVDKISPTWRTRAATETLALISAGCFTLPSTPATLKVSSKTSPPSIWAEIKIVFMELQHYKCIYCERALAASEGKIEHDIEHFRPKNSLAVWSPPAGYPHLVHRGGQAANTGYYWLAYDLQNYAAACKSCNTVRKRNFFPIAGRRGSATQDVPSLNAQEQPILIFPFSEDPSLLLKFDGVFAQPVSSSGPLHDRAIGTIALFNLNGRPELWEDRLRTISAVFHAVETRQTGTTRARRDDAKETLTRLTRDGAPQAACARAFFRLMHTDPERAWTVYRYSRKFVESS